MTDMAQTVIDDKNVNDNKYSKNERYSQEEINKLVKIYHMADAVGDKETVKDAYSKICEYIEKYVYKTLWDNYKTLMQNSSHREDIIQDVWVKILSELKNYDPDKGAITTFIAPWIKHVVADYSSKNFRKTSVYYANAMKQINGAQNYCKQYGLNPDDVETIMRLTGLSEATVKNTLDLMSKKDSVSYEALIDAGADYMTTIKGPEESVIESESERNLKELLDDVLTDEEMELLRLLLNPENSNKKHSSYREIAEQIPGSNIPKIKRKISRITTKLKNNQRFGQLYPYIIAQEKALENNYMPVLYDDGDDDDDMYNDFDTMDEKSGWKYIGSREELAQKRKTRKK